MYARSVVKLILASAILAYACNPKQGKGEGNKTYIFGTILNFGNSAILERNGLYGSLMEESYVLDINDR